VLASLQTRSEKQELLLQRDSTGMCVNAKQGALHMDGVRTAPIADLKCRVGDACKPG
jgi:hypothetical protein